MSLTFFELWLRLLDDADFEEDEKRERIWFWACCMGFDSAGSNISTRSSSTLTIDLNDLWPEIELDLSHRGLDYAETEGQPLVMNHETGSFIFCADWLFEAEVRQPSLKIPDDEDWVGMSKFFSFSVNGLTLTG